MKGAGALRLEPGGTDPSYLTSPNLLGGFAGNFATAGVAGAAIGGGGGSIGNCLGIFTPCPNRVTDHFGTVGGGVNNQAGDGAGTIADRRFATVGGGFSNTASGEYAAVGGGRGNTASAQDATVGGGNFNQATSFVATVAGGQANLASASAATVGGGDNNIASGSSATVPGGFGNRAGGNLSFAAGNQARVRTPAQSGDADGDEGTFVWADAQFGVFTSTGPNQFLVRAAGGVGINTNSPVGELQLGSAADTTAFRFGNAGARNHLISNRDMVFDAHGGGSGVAFYWRENSSSFDESGFTDLMILTSAGDLSVTGTLTKGGGAFKIDHPLDPLRQYLSHSFVESPDMKNIYDGVVTTDREGFAIVELPAWFEALNRDFRYQLTVIGGGAWARARIVQKIRENRFVIQTDVPETEVSWQVTGIRHDPYARRHPIVVEETKPAGEQGRYLHPDAYDLTFSPSPEKREGQP